MQTHFTSEKSKHTKLIYTPYTYLKCLRMLKIASKMFKCTIFSRGAYSAPRTPSCKARALASLARIYFSENLNPPLSKILDPPLHTGQ